MQSFEIELSPQDLEFLGTDDPDKVEEILAMLVEVYISELAANLLRPVDDSGLDIRGGG
jgi:hypothetical protein